MCLPYLKLLGLCDDVSKVPFERNGAVLRMLCKCMQVCVCMHIIKCYVTDTSSVIV